MQLVGVLTLLDPHMNPWDLRMIRLGHNCPLFSPSLFFLSPPPPFHFYSLFVYYKYLEWKSPMEPHCLIHENLDKSDFFSLNLTELYLLFLSLFLLGTFPSISQIQVVFFIFFFSSLLLQRSLLNASKAHSFSTLFPLWCTVVKNASFKFFLYKKSWKL